MLQRKHTRLVEHIRQAALQTEGQKSGSEPEHEDFVRNQNFTRVQIIVCGLVLDCAQSRLMLLQVQDLGVLEEVIRMVLEIINSTLTHSLRNNPNLIYTLLYNKDMFIAHFRIHPTFQDIIQNIDTVGQRRRDRLRVKCSLCR